MLQKRLFLVILMVSLGAGTGCFNSSGLISVSRPTPGGSQNSGLLPELLGSLTEVNVSGTLSESANFSGYSSLGSAPAGNVFQGDQYRMTGVTAILGTQIIEGLQSE